MLPYMIFLETQDNNKSNEPIPVSTPTLLYMIVFETKDKNNNRNKEQLPEGIRMQATAHTHYAGSTIDDSIVVGRTFTVLVGQKQHATQQRQQPRNEV